MSKPGKSKKNQEQAEPVASPAESQAASATQTEPTFEQIQQRAYEIYVERGDTEGNEEDDWQRAERELRGINP
jgi:DUF2934 family protein